MIPCTARLTFPLLILGYTMALYDHWHTVEGIRARAFGSGINYRTGIQTCPNGMQRNFVLGLVQGMPLLYITIIKG